jgi:hypothetical protein
MSGLIDAVGELVRDKDERVQRDAENELVDEPILRRADVDRAALFGKIYSAMTVEHFPPVALGSGRASLVNKVAALIHAFWLLSGWAMLQSLLSNVVSITTDLGTECKLADFECADIRKLQPRWIVDAEMVDDTGESVFTTPFLFKSALPIAGLLHIFSNAMNDVNRALENWDTFYDSLKIIEALVSVPYRLERFVTLCLIGGPLEAVKWKLEKKIPHLYEKRWGEVHSFCLRLNDILSILRQGWNQRTYIGGNTDNTREDIDGSKFRPAEITRVVNDNFFAAYVMMVIALNSVLAEMAAMLERCPCHEHVQNIYRGHVPRRVAVEEFGAAADEMHGLACPLRGCFSAEVALGMIRDCLRSAFDNARAELTLQCRHVLSTEEWAALVKDFSKARAHLVYVISYKTQHWKDLPWFLCSLASFDTAVARDSCKKILSIFDAMPTDVLHHRLTTTFCATGGPLRHQMEAFAAGESLRTLTELRLEINKLRLIPLTERAAERPHSLIMKAVTHKNHGPLSVAFAFRGAELEKKFSNPERFEQLVEQAALCRNPKDVARLFSLTRHPWIQLLQEKSVHSNLWPSVISKLLYRCDGLSQFHDLSEARGIHDSSFKARVKATVL